MVLTFPRRFVFAITIIIILLASLLFIFFVFKPSLNNKANNINSLETIKPGSCLILEQKFCSKGEVFEDPRFPGRTFIGFNLPKDTKIFSDEDGITTFSKVNTFGIVNAILSTSSSPDKSTTSIWGDVKFTKASGIIKIGDETGVVQDTGIKINGKYNVVVNFGTRDAQGNFGDDVKAIQRLLPSVK